MSDTTDILFQKQRTSNKSAKVQAERDESAWKAILADLFEEQQLFVTDPDRRKSLLTPRRAGKTHTAISYALIAALQNPGCVVPIITLTLRSAKRLYWDPFAEFSRKYALNLEYKRADNTIALPNGSKIFLNGAETGKDIEKLRGGAYQLVLIDECKSFQVHIFEELIDDILRAATNDTNGSICIIGTPGSVLDGPFYEATCPNLRDEDGDLITRSFNRPEKFWTDHPKKMHRWSRHTWTVQENTFCPHIWENFLEDKARKKWSDDNPTWMREALGKWVSMGDTMVYALNQLVSNDGGPSACRAVWTRLEGEKYNQHGLPKDMDWRYIMGMDMGFNDDFALIVVAYSPYLDTLYQVYDFKSPHMIVPQIAALIQRVQDKFNGQIEEMVADTGNLAKMVIETLNQQYGFFIQAAEKTEKFDHIELLNSDLYDGKVKLLANSDMYDEMMHLQWDLKGMDKKTAIRRNKLKEDKRMDNHLCDALLYTWRFSLHHFSRTKVVPPEPETHEFYQSWDDAQYKEACERYKAKQQNDQYEEEWTNVLIAEDGSEWLM